MSAIVVDLGGTLLRCAVSRTSSENCVSLSHVVAKRIDNFLNSERKELIWTKVISQILEYEISVRYATNPTDPIVLAFPGPISGGKILNAPTVSGTALRIPDLGCEIHDQTHRRVYVLNDVSAAAWYFSTLLSCPRFLIVTVSSGIGSKVFDKNSHGRVFDSIPYAGEIGHIVVDRSLTAPVCDCGGKGHLGAIASGRGIERAARMTANYDRQGFHASTCVRTFNAELDTLNNEDHIIPAALKDDPWALEIITACTEPLAKVLVTLIMGLGLERVVIIGGFASALGTTYLKLLRSQIANQINYPLLSAQVPDMLELGVNGNDACLRGAAVYAGMLARS